jgi:hypothetical protein
MSAGFTPGPWAFLWDVHDTSKREPSSGVAWLGNGDIKQRCRVDVAGPNTFANAQLIAAAPDMYDALIEAERYIADAEAGFDCKWIGLKAVRSALAKARGEQVQA